LTRPLGAALATFGIAGILIGTLSLGFSGGNSAAAPLPAAGAGAAADRNAESLVASGAPEAPGNLQPLPETSAAAASAAAPVPAASAAASAAAAAPSTPADTAGGGFGSLDGQSAAPSAPTSVGIAAAPSTGQVTHQETTSTTSADDGSSGRSSSPLLILSGVALVLGVALLVLARRRENEAR
jgi:LPXTG-motif cell wall-anchored protein